MTRSKSPLQKSILYFLCLSACLVNSVLILKFIFLWRYDIQVAGVESRQLQKALLLGLQYDWFLLQWLLLPVLLTSFLLFKLKPLSRKLLWVLQITWLGAAILLWVIDIEFYGAYQTRLNSNLIEYSQDLAPTLSLLYDSFHFLNYLGLFLLLWLSFSVCSWKIFQNLLTQPTASSKKWQFLLALFLVLILLDGVRQNHLLNNRKDARKLSENTFLRALATNPLANLLFEMVTFRDFYGRLGERGYLQKNLTALRALLFLPQEQALSEKVPLLRQSQSVEINPSAPQPPYNIVIIYLESMMGERTGALGAEVDWSPNFNRLSEEGILFNHFFSNAPRTGRALESSDHSFPNLPIQDRLTSYDKSDSLLSIQRILKKQGYKTLYIRSWHENVRYIKNFDEFLDYEAMQDRDNYSSKFKFNIVSDEVLFKNALRILATQPQPFLSVIQTQSSHPPYSCPCENYEEGFRFMDAALGKFFQEVKNQPYFDKTLFVLFGDHGGPLYNNNEYQLERYYVPLLFYAPKILGTVHEKRTVVSSQVDLVPTILGLARIQAEHAGWGRNLFLLPPSEGGFAYFSGAPEGSEYGWVTPTHIILQSGQDSVQYFTYTQKPLKVKRVPSAEISYSLRADKARLDLYIKSAYNAFLFDQMGPKD